MTKMETEFEEETATRLDHRAELSGSEVSDVVRDAVEVYLQLENPEELINESDSE